MRETLRLIYSVFKVRIGLAIMLTALAGLAMTPGPSVPAWQVLALAAAVLASSAAAGAFNQYVERDLDARMARTRGRPFVTGVFRPGAPWLFGIASLLVVAVGGAALAINWVAALHVFLGAFVYGVVYTVWLKQRTAWNIVVGGLAGSFAVLAGAATVDPVPGPVPMLMALTLFLWTPPHFWSLAMGLKKDYAAAGVPMLPVVVGDIRAARIIFCHTVAVVAASLTPLLFGAGWIYGLAAAAGGAGFIFASIRLLVRPDVRTAMANFHASLIQLSLLLLGAIAGHWAGA